MTLHRVSAVAAGLLSWASLSLAQPSSTLTADAVKNIEQQVSSTMSRYHIPADFGIEPWSELFALKSAENRRSDPPAATPLWQAGRGTMWVGIYLVLAAPLSLIALFAASETCDTDCENNLG